MAVDGARFSNAVNGNDSDGRIPHSLQLITAAPGAHPPSHNTEMDNTDDILFAKFAELDQKVASLREDMDGIVALLERRKRSGCSISGSSNDVRNLESHKGAPSIVENVCWTTNKTVPAQNVVQLPLPVPYDIDSPSMTYQPYQTSCKVFREYNKLKSKQILHDIHKRYHLGNNPLSSPIRKGQKIGSTPNFSSINPFPSHLSCHPYSYPYGRRHFSSGSEQSLVYPIHENTGFVDWFFSSIFFFTIIIFIFRNCYPLLSPTFSYSKITNRNQLSGEDNEGDDPPSDPEDNGEEEGEDVFFHLFSQRKGTLQQGLTWN
uniref:Uncharacterized protein n=1 Tax=Heterorhabditis bacteriophora TaxID=37862 RepID=A0A1I7WTH6_HETBA